MPLIDRLRKSPESSNPARSAGSLYHPTSEPRRTAYLTVPQYNKFFREIGYQNEARAALEARKVGDRKKSFSLVPGSIVDAIFISGTPDRWRMRLRDYEKAGIRLRSNSTATRRPPKESALPVMAAREALAARW
jgi:luciferase-like monooxygenase